MSETKRPGRPKGLKPPKRQYPLKLDEETREQLAAAAYWTRQSANAIVEEGIRIRLEQLQATHNDGKPFLPKPGKPMPTAAPGVPQDAATNREGQQAGEKPGKRQRGGRARGKGKGH